MQIDETKLINAVSVFCQDRSLTHIMMATSTYVLYSNNLNRDLRKKGILHAFCHKVAIIPQDWVPRNTLIGFNANTSTQVLREIKQIMSAIRVGDDLTAEEIIVALCSEQHTARRRPIKVRKLKEKP